MGLFPFFLSFCNPDFLHPYVKSFLSHHASDATLPGDWQSCLKAETWQGKVEGRNAYGKSV
jgi:hypothetical protein